jgi:hypothetical protein
MKFFKIVFVLGLIAYGAYWGMTSGVTWWQQREIQQAIDLYKEETGYHPRSISDLKKKKYENEAGHERRFLSEIPIPRAGYCWDYNVRQAEVMLKELPEEYRDKSGPPRVCPRR